MRPTNWNFTFILAAIFGCVGGYLFTLLFCPNILPAAFRFGSLSEPMTVLFLGTDVVYNDMGHHKKANKDAFTGRSDTIMVARLDPYRNTAGILSIPRDTQVYISGNGTQKINAANAIGGPNLASATISQFLQLPIEHYVILNVHGLVELVNEIGGVTIEIPKRMQYMDWTAKLKIDLNPGPHTLTGNQAMGFVRYRHDELGDIGRVQRQEIFIRAVLDKAMQPTSWVHIPKLIEIAQKYIQTDMSLGQLMRIANFMRAVPKKNQVLVMMPGTFSGTGDWLVSRSNVYQMVARITGANFIPPTREGVRLTIVNVSNQADLGIQLARWLHAKGYVSIMVKPPFDRAQPRKWSRIIAECANPQDANLLKDDLGNCGEIINASVGDIESNVTILAGDDIANLLVAKPIDTSTQRHFHRRHRYS